MVHSKNYKRLQHNSCRLSYRNSISRANQGQKFTKKQLSKVKRLSKRQQYDVMISRLMFAKTVNSFILKRQKYDLLQKFNKLPHDLQRHINSFIHEKHSAITMETFVEDVLYIDRPNLRYVPDRYRRQRSIAKEGTIYFDPYLRFVKYKDKVYNIRSTKFNKIYNNYVKNLIRRKKKENATIIKRALEKGEYVEELCRRSNGSFALTKRLLTPPPSLPDKKDYYLKSYKHYLVISCNIEKEQDRKREDLLTDTAYLDLLTDTVYSLTHEKHIIKYKSVSPYLTYEEYFDLLTERIIILTHKKHINMSFNRQPDYQFTVKFN